MMMTLHLWKYMTKTNSSTNKCDCIINVVFFFFMLQHNLEKLDLRMSVAAAVAGQRPAPCGIPSCPIPSRPKSPCDVTCRVHVETRDVNYSNIKGVIHMPVEECSCYTHKFRWMRSSPELSNSI